MQLSINLTEREVFALVTAVQLATPKTKQSIIQIDAVAVAKRVQALLDKNSTLFRHLEQSWRKQEGC
jgi:hypothetical protein